MTMLCQCLGELWTARDGELAMIQSVGGKWRQEVSYANVWQWIQEVREAVDGEEDEWLVVGINVAPFSIEETASMLMVAQQRHWSYVPVDVQLPVAKQRSILTNARVQRLVTIPESPLAKFLSTEEKRTVELPSSPFRSVQVLRFTDGYFQSKGENSVRRFQAKADGDVAPLYVLFTSGTTGEPRGVLGTRVGAWTRLQWMWEMYPFTRASERVLRATKLSFVDSVWEILGAFLQDDSAQFLAVVQSEHVTRFTAVPSVLEVLLLQMREIDRQSALSKLRYVLSSGESLPLQVLRQLWATLPEATILNLYGSTEVSGDVTCMELRAPASAVEAVEWQQHGVPIAKLDRRGIVGNNTSLVLLPIDIEKKANESNDGAPTIIWSKNLSVPSTAQPCRGLLYVSGPLVTLGYVGGDLEDIFVSTDELLGDQKSQGEAKSRRWFCTGDVCSAIQGYLFFCGRKDNAVKIHGQRVYLEAVERAVTTALSETVKDGEIDDSRVSQTFGNAQVIAFTTAKEVSKYALRQQHIVACIICDVMSSTAVGRYPRATKLNAWITEHYGSSHSPHEIVVVHANAVQRLAHGKVDRRALKDLFDRGRIADINAVLPIIRNNCEANSTTEGLIARLLNEVLDIPTPEVFAHEIRQELGTFPLTGQELLHMTIGAMLSKVGSPLDKRLREETTVKALPRFINSRNDTAKVDRDRDLSFGKELKRRKMARRAQSDGLTDGDGNEHGDTSQRDKLNFVSRYNQSSMSSNGIYTPTCYISPPPTQQTAPTPSLSWELRTAWKVDLEKCIDASPLVVQRLDAKDVICSSWAIVGSHSAQLVCVDLEDAGKEIWRVQLDDRIEACAALSVKHEIVYVGTYAGTLFALDLCLGDTRWLFHAKGTIKASAVAIDKYGVVVCGSYDNSLYGLDAVTGKLRWFLDLQGSIFSTPLYCAWSGQLFAASTTGTVVAVKSGADDFGSIIEQWKLELPAPVFAGLNADYDSKKLIVGCADGKLYGVDMTAGAIQWQLSTEKPIFSSPCVYHPGVVVFGSHDGRLRKVDCHSGQLVWTTNLHGAVFASPTVVRLVGTPLDRQPRHNFTVAEEEGSLVCCVTTTTGQLYFCDEETGSIIYQSGNSSGKVLVGANSCESSGDLGPLFGSPVLVDNWCLLGTRTNDFFGFEFTGCSPGLSRVRPYSGKSGGSAT
ncbi:hypothetical protein PRNP1_005651 [Phytophthora ramorum]